MKIDKDLIPVTYHYNPENNNQTFEPEVIPPVVMQSIPKTAVTTSGLGQFPFIILLPLLFFLPIFNSGGNIFKGLGSLTNDKVVDLVSEIAPYLSPDTQPAIYTLRGAMEAAGIVSNLTSGNYQKNITPMRSRSSPNEKMTGILSAVKGWMPDNEGRMIDTVMSIFKVIDRLSGNMQIFGNNFNLRSDSRIDPAETITELFHALAPLIPGAAGQQIDTVLKAVQLITTLNGSSALAGGADDSDGIGNVINSLKGMLNNEQQETLENFIDIAGNEEDE